MRYYCLRFCLPAIFTFIVFLSIIKFDLKDDRPDFSETEYPFDRKQRRDSKSRENHTVLQNIRDSFEDPKSQSDLELEKLGCFDCDPEQLFRCPKDRRTWIQDKKVLIPFTNRSLLTTPDGFIVKKSGLLDAGLGVWTTKNISQCVVFGPYGGVELYDHTKPWEAYAYAWQITDENDEIDHWVDAEDPSLSNWLRYVNSPMTEGEANLEYVQYKGKIYYQVINAIPEGKTEEDSIKTEAARALTKFIENFQDTHKDTKLRSPCLADIRTHPRYYSCPCYVQE